MTNTSFNLLPTNNKKNLVVITSLAHNDMISFFPYNFEVIDSFKPSFQSYDVFGRMDAIQIFKSTSRDITLNFKVVAEDADDYQKRDGFEDNGAVKYKLNNFKNSVNYQYDLRGTAENNFANLNKLIKFLYPVYDGAYAGFDKSYYEKLKQDAKNKYQLLPTESFNEEGMQVMTAQEQAANAETNTVISEVLEKAISTITQQQIERQNQANSINALDVKIIKKSPLFRFEFMNLLNNQQFICAITGFSHKFNFEAGGSFVDSEGNAVPGEIDISITMKILHTSIPGQGDWYPYM